MKNIKNICTGCSKTFIKKFCLLLIEIKILDSNINPIGIIDNNEYGKKKNGDTKIINKPVIIIKNKNGFILNPA